MDYLQEADKEIEANKSKHKKMRQNHLFDKDLYLKFKKFVGDKRVGESLEALMRAYLKYKGIK